MALTDQQYGKLAEAFAEHVVDTMDLKCLMQFAFDCILENLPMNPDELIAEILDSYDQEVLDSLMETIN
jgi:hypothetical protein